MPRPPWLGNLRSSPQDRLAPLPLASGSQAATGAAGPRGAGHARCSGRRTAPPTLLHHSGTDPGRTTMPRYLVERTLREGLSIPADDQGPRPARPRYRRPSRYWPSARWPSTETCTAGRFPHTCSERYSSAFRPTPPIAPPTTFASLYGSAIASCSRAGSVVTPLCGRACRPAAHAAHWRRPLARRLLDRGQFEPSGWLVVAWSHDPP